MIREVNKLVYEEEVGVDGKLESIFERALEWRILPRTGRRNCGKEKEDEILRSSRKSFSLLYKKKMFIIKKKRDNIIHIFDTTQDAAAIRIYKDHRYKVK